MEVTSVHVARIMQAPVHSKNSSMTRTPNWLHRHTIMDEYTLDCNSPSMVNRPIRFGADDVSTNLIGPCAG